MLSSTTRTIGHRPTVSSKGATISHLVRYRKIVICRNKIGDELLDFVTAGPKLRKWYGAGERPVDGGEEQEPEEPDTTSDVVLVTDADSPIGEQVVLQLILARQQLRLLVRDVAAAKTAYGPYATPLPADAGTNPRALRGVKCLVLLGRPVRGLMEAAKAARVKHVVLLSSAPASALSKSGGFSLGGFSLAGGPGGSAARELRELGDSAAEAALKASGMPYSVVQVYGLQDPGRSGSGAGGVVLQQRQQVAGGGVGSGSGSAVSREAVAALIGSLVDAVPSRGRTLQATGSGQAAALSPTYSPQRQQEALVSALQGLMEDA
ncbi:hypothetical protein Vretimale_6801 [Volvox reticuliferus]|uniref:NAD(P)-binding domain-containing protein n=1 Tax=Volvox reticuliferus TaxID=1737510 RepID=A0A8J4G8F1_9CHLO|nr:hypothetical protein Vretifemale_7131 [Volvox reticuliferus]GIM02069.1 hypothetical protein Vretimale_6801 [Volvox reticuliferus]